MCLRSDHNDVMVPGDKIVVGLFVKTIQFMREISLIKNKWSVRLEERAEN